MEPAEARASILVVEDDILMSEGIADVLRVEGYQVETAFNGRAALAKMQVSTPDLVLSDIMMPEMNGLEFCALVRANSAWRTLPFIFLTALEQKIDQRRGLELGALECRRPRLDRKIPVGGRGAPGSTTPSHPHRSASSGYRRGVHHPSDRSPAGQRYQVRQERGRSCHSVGH
jgi:CheY-like chemotaxis protein